MQKLKIDEPEKYKKGRGYERVKIRREKDPLFKFKCNLRNLIKNSLTKQGYTKKSKTYDIVGVEFQDFKIYIETKFVEGMSWENANPSSYNVDYFTGISPQLVDDSQIPTSSSNYWKSDTMFDLKYCNWNKDMLMGVLPNSQFGDVAVIDLGNSTSGVLVSDASGNSRSVDIATALTSSANSSPVSVHLPAGETVPKDSSLYVNLKDISSQMTVLALRQAEALQRWKEISQSGDSLS